MKLFPILFLVFFFFAQSIYCQKAVLQDDQTVWNVALAEFKISSSKEDITYISNVLPSFLFSQFSGITTHTLSSEEILLRRKKIISAQINAEEKKLSSYIKEYDNAYFTNTEKRRELKNKINDSKKNLRQLNRYNSSKIAVPSVKDILFVTSDEKDNSLKFDILEIYNYADEKKFDYIIYGSARQFENIVILEINLYSLLEKKNIYSTSVSNEIGTLFLSFDNIISDMTSILLGAAWSKITVNTDNRDSDIYLDEKYIGTGSALNIFASPGAHLVTIKGQGQEGEHISVFLDEKKNNVIDFNVTLKEEKLTAINTLPQEANVYLDSLWVGVTPFLLNGLSGELIIRKEGFRDIRLFLDDIPQNSIEIKLSPDIFSKEEFLSKKRKSFYTSLSFFVLSVPLSFFLYAVTSEYNSAYNSAIISRNNYDEINRLGRISNYTFYGYHASLFLTFTFFVNTMFKLSDYITAGDVLYEKK